jgi:putative tryptophan/tyrosine transport system substrate-binding protein
VEGQNITLEYRLTDGSPARASEAAADLVTRKVDVILAWTTTMANAAQRATAIIPIVIVGISDPIGTGLVGSLARPGGSSLAALANPDNPSAHPLLLRGTEDAVRTLGVRLLTLDVRVPDELDSAFLRMAAEGARGVVVLPDPLLLSERRKIAKLAQKAQLPTMFGRRENLDVGGLLSYGPNLRDQFRQTAIYIDRILRGAAPAELPVEQPTRIELIINLKTAKTLGIDVPPTLLARADEVIE